MWSTICMTEYLLCSTVHVFLGKCMIGAIRCLVFWWRGVFFPHNPSNPAVGPKTYQFLAALMGRSGLGKHRNSPLRSGRVVQSSSKGGNLSQVGWLSVIAIDGWPPQPVLSPVLPPSPVIAPMCMCVCTVRENLPEPSQALKFKSWRAAQFTFRQVHCCQPSSTIWLSLSRFVAPGFHSAHTCATTEFLHS